MAFQWRNMPQDDSMPWRLFRQVREDENARLYATIVVKRCQGCPNSIWRGGAAPSCRTKNGDVELDPDEVNIPEWCRLPLYHTDKSPEHQESPERVSV